MVIARHEILAFAVAVRCATTPASLFRLLDGDDDYIDEFDPGWLFVYEDLLDEYPLEGRMSAGAP